MMRRACSSDRPQSMKTIWYVLQPRSKQNVNTFALRRPLTRLYTLSPSTDKSSMLLLNLGPLHSYVDAPYEESHMRLFFCQPTSFRSFAPLTSRSHFSVSSSHCFIALSLTCAKGRGYYSQITSRTVNATPRYPLLYHLWQAHVSLGSSSLSTNPLRT